MVSSDHRRARASGVSVNVNVGEASIRGKRSASSRGLEEEERWRCDRKASVDEWRQDSEPLEVGRTTDVRSTNTSAAARKLGGADVGRRYRRVVISSQQTSTVADARSDLREDLHSRIHAAVARAGLLASRRRKLARQFLKSRSVADALIVTRVASWRAS